MTETQQGVRESVSSHSWQKNGDTHVHSLMRVWWIMIQKKITRLCCLVQIILTCILWYLLYGNAELQAKALNGFNNSSGVEKTKSNIKNSFIGQVAEWPTGSTFNQTVGNKNYHSLLNEKLPPYLDNYRNPCWIERIPNEDPYKFNKYYDAEVEQAEKVYATLKNLSQTWEQLVKQGEKLRIRCLPYLYLAGFAKCGTSDIYQKLTMHPMVAQGPIKEYMFWGPLRVGQRNSNNEYVPICHYINLFDGAAKVIQNHPTVQEGGSYYHPIVTLDACPVTAVFTFFWKRLPENDGNLDYPTYHTCHYIHHVSPQAHVILTMRNPVDRLWSDYQFFNLNGSAEHFHEEIMEYLPALEQCLRKFSPWQCVIQPSTLSMLKRGFYYPYVEQWMKVFPREQLHFIQLEEYAQNRVPVLQDLVTKLGLGSYPEEILDHIATKNEIANTKEKWVLSHNQTAWTGPRMMKPDTKQYLEQFFAPWNKKLSKLLGDEKFHW